MSEQSAAFATQRAVELHALNAELVRLRALTADLLAALRAIDAIATAKKAKAINCAQDVARAAIAKAEGKL